MPPPRVVAPRSMLPALTLLVAACAGGPPEPAVPPMLAYDLPEPPTSTYLLGDTTRVEVDAAGQSFDLSVASRAELTMEYARIAGGRGLRVTARIVDFRGHADNPMGAASSVGIDDVTGVLVFDLDRRGRARIVSALEADGVAGQLLQPESFVAELVPRLPGRPVVTGSAWSDTISWESSGGDASSSATVVRSYTVTGDTVVGGRGYLKVRFEGDEERVISGRLMGSTFRQELAGPGAGHFLWDAEARRVESVEAASTLTGTMEIPLLSFPLSVRVRNTQRVRRPPPQA